MINKKVVSMRELKFTKMYESYYKDIRNVQFARSCFIKADVVNKTNKIS